MSDDEWKLVDRYDIREYRCGLKAGDRVKLLKDIVVTSMSTNKPTGEVHKAGEIWRVLAGSSQDPGVVFFLQPDGNRHTWDDDTSIIFEWFARI